VGDEARENETPLPTPAGAERLGCALVIFYVAAVFLVVAVLAFIPAVVAALVNPWLGPVAAVGSLWVWSRIGPQPFPGFLPGTLSVFGYSALLGSLIGTVVFAIWGDPRAFVTADSWHAPAPDSGGFTPLDKGRFAVVVPELQAEAQTVLSEAPVKRVTASEAARFAGGPLPEGEAYVLLRSVALNEEYGTFDISANGTAVHVRHGCLGRGPVPMRRKALVAVLPSLPDKVFVDCSMAK
jgi:hypothetical protein